MSRPPGPVWPACAPRPAGPTSARARRTATSTAAMASSTPCQRPPAPGSRASVATATRSVRPPPKGSRSASSTTPPRRGPEPARSRIRGRDGDSPCLYTIPEGFSGFPYPGIGYGVVYAVRQTFPVAGPPPEAAARAFVCYQSDGLRCNRARGCVRLANADEECRESGSCIGTAHCDQTRSRCLTRKPVGAGCEPQRYGDSPCVEGAYCDSTTRVCAVRVAVGEPCRQDSQCRSGACVNERCDRSDLAELGAAQVCGRN